MSHGRFYTYRLPTVTILSQLRLAEYMAKTRPDIPVVDISPPNNRPATADDDDDAELRRTLNEAEILFGDPKLIVPHWSELKKVRWVQSTWAGNDLLFRALTPPNASKPVSPPFTVTRFAGSFGPLMAEFVVGHLVADQRQFFELAEDQKAKKWDHEQRGNYRPLSSLSIGILGVGEIGREIARVCKQGFGMRVLGLVSSTAGGREEPHVDQLMDFSRLPELLHDADYVCNVLPSTPQTKGLLSGETLSYCRFRKPVFINVGRGDVVDEDSLQRALDRGYISKAVLDVFDPEPLPAESPLWNRPDVVISPHVSSVTLDFQVAKVFGDNFDRFVQEQPLKYVLDWTKGY